MKALMKKKLNVVGFVVRLVKMLQFVSVSTCIWPDN